MSAPVTERARAGATRSRTATIPAQRGAPVQPYPGRGGEPMPSAQSSGPDSARDKAYARRDERVRRIGGARQPRTAAPSGRPQFVLLIMVLLAAGLVATLWLSTAAAADSYRLKDATAEARALSEQAERLHREVAVLASAPELARRATALGMVPVQDPARLVVAPGGSVAVVGEPRAAVGAPPPAPPAPPGQVAPPGQPGRAAPQAPGQPQPGTPAEGTTPGTDPTVLAAPGQGAQDPLVDGGVVAPEATEATEATGGPGTATAEGTGGAEATEPGTGAQAGGEGSDGDTADSSGPASAGSDRGGTDAG